MKIIEYIKNVSTIKESDLLHELIYTKMIKLKNSIPCTCNCSFKMQYSKYKHFLDGTKSPKKIGTYCCNCHGKV